MLVPAGPSPCTKWHRCSPSCVAQILGGVSVSFFLSDPVFKSPALGSALKIHPESSHFSVPFSSQPGPGHPLSRLSSAVTGLSAEFLPPYSPSSTQQLDGSIKRYVRSCHFGAQIRQCLPSTFRTKAKICITLKNLTCSGLDCLLLLASHPPSPSGLPYPRQVAGAAFQAPKAAGTLRLPGGVHTCCALCR